MKNRTFEHHLEKIDASILIISGLKNQSYFEKYFDCSDYAMAINRARYYIQSQIPSHILEYYIDDKTEAFLSLFELPDKEGLSLVMENMVEEFLQREYTGDDKVFPGSDIDPKWVMDSLVILCIQHMKNKAKELNDYAEKDLELFRVL